MSAQFTAIAIDLGIGVGGSILAALYGFRVLGPKEGVNAQFDSLHAKYMKHLKWIGPLSAVFNTINGALSLYSLGA